MSNSDAATIRPVNQGTEFQTYELRSPEGGFVCQGSMTVCVAMAQRHGWTWRHG